MEFFSDRNCTILSSIVCQFLSTALPSDTLSRALPRRQGVRRGPEALLVTVKKKIRGSDFARVDDRRSPPPDATL